MVDDSQLRRVREALEACRPGSDDLRAPELADVTEALVGDATLRLARRRIEQWDAALAQAMQQVAAPEGLAERILARLAAPTNAVSAVEKSPLAVVVDEAVGANGPGMSDESVQPAQSEPAQSEPAQRAWQFWHWSGIALSAVIAASLVLVAGYWLRWESDTSFDVLAQQWHDELTDQWQPVARAPRDLPFPKTMRILPTRWQRIGGLTPTPVVAYELTDGKTKAILYAARMSRPGLGTSPPAEAQYNSGGKAVGYWNSGGIVYVLVVNDVNHYRAFVRPSQSPLAFRPARLARAA